MPIKIDEFGAAAIRIMDEIRSNGADPNNADDSSVRVVESRINAFYRALGLPAFQKTKTDKKKRPKEDMFSVANIFPSSESGDEKVNEAAGRDAKFLNILTEEDQKKFLTGGSKETVEKSLTDRLKGSMFPMIVNGDLKIYPQAKRVAGAFFQKASEITKNNVVYRRPLIELIALLRLRRDYNIDATAQKAIDDQFEQLQFFDGSEKNILVLGIIKALEETVSDPDGITKDINETINMLGRIQAKYVETFKDQGNNNPAAQPLSAGSDNTGSDERFAATRKKIARENEAKLSMLEYEDIYGSKTRNMREAIMSPMIIDIMLSDTDYIDKEIAKTELKNEKAKSLQKSLWKRMDSILGTFSGISGIDIVSTITALFTIEETHLLGLLNKDSIDRLRVISGGDTSISPADVFSSIEALQQKVQSLHTDVEKTAQPPKLLERGRKEAPKGER